MSGRTSSGERSGERRGVIGVIGRCSASGCARAAAHHLELQTAGGRTLRGVLCERCARATACAAFLLDLIA